MYAWVQVRICECLCKGQRSTSGVMAQEPSTAFIHVRVRVRVCVLNIHLRKCDTHMLCDKNPLSVYDFAIDLVSG